MPDFEETIEAKDKSEAVELFTSILNREEGGWDPSMIEDLVQEIK